MNHGRPDYNRRIIDTDGLIPKDEPVILLRGRDPASIVAARAYAAEVQRLNGPDCVVQRVSDQADAMEVYQRNHGARLAD